jgi:tRNA pseudouridine38-40 synthase
MFNYKAVIEFDGTGFSGFQIQPGESRTVQGEIVKVLSRIFDRETGIAYAGRTDAGVHAVSQVINFKCGRELDLYKFKWSLNRMLPDDISVRHIEKAPEDFNSRRDALWREYRYFIVNGDYQNVFLKKYSILVCRKLDIELMAECTGYFVGKKDFTSFCSPEDDKVSKIREVLEFELYKSKDFGPEELLVFRIKANSFLYNMARIIVGTVLEAGKGLRDIASINDAFDKRNRDFAGDIVEARGLFLTGVGYK